MELPLLWGSAMQATKRSRTLRLRQFVRRRLPLILVLAALMSAALLLRQTGRLDALVEAARRFPLVEKLAPPPDFPVFVVEEFGQPVAKFQIMLQSADRGETTWEDGTNGQATLSGFESTHYRDLQAIDVVIRAEGFATALARFAGPDRDTLFGGKATITMRHGEPVELRFRLPEGLRLPDDFAPEVYFADHRDAVRIMWDPDNRRAYQGHMPDFNFFNVERGKDGRFVLRLARESDPFYVAIHRPGLLQQFEAGPFTLADVARGILDIPVPKPASLGVVFDPGAAAARALPFDGVTVEANIKNAPASSYFRVARLDAKAGRQRLDVNDLAPGVYQAAVLTRGKLPASEPLPKTPHPAFFSDSADVVLFAGEKREIHFRYTPLDSNIFRGSCSATIRIVNFDGSPASRVALTVSYRDPHYGDLEVFTGKTSRSGEVEVRDITEWVPPGTTAGPYRIALNGQGLGSFGLTQGKTNEVVVCRLPPQVGDAAPDVDLVNVTTGAHSRLHDFRGEVVCLELWATWCGPCQEAMRQLHQMAAGHRAAWRNRVAIVPVSIDERPEVVMPHVKPRSWDQIDHYWSGSDGATKFDSPAWRAFGGQGVPEVFIIDRHGRISWIGNPNAKAGEADLASRVQKALER
jgi:thiol-disulfide isomerase/thioredoxin